MATADHLHQAFEKLAPDTRFQVDRVLRMTAPQILERETRAVAIRGAVVVFDVEGTVLVEARPRSHVHGIAARLRSRIARPTAAQIAALRELETAAPLANYRLVIVKEDTIVSACVLPPGGAAQALLLGAEGLDETAAETAASPTAIDDVLVVLDREGLQRTRAVFERPIVEAIGRVNAGDLAEDLSIFLRPMLAALRELEGPQRMKALGELCPIVLPMSRKVVRRAVDLYPEAQRVSLERAEWEGVPVVAFAEDLAQSAVVLPADIAGPFYTRNLLQAMLIDVQARTAEIVRRGPENVVVVVIEPCMYDELGGPALLGPLRRSTVPCVEVVTHDELRALCGQPRYRYQVEVTCGTSLGDGEVTVAVVTRLGFCAMAVPLVPLDLPTITGGVKS